MTPSRLARLAAAGTLAVLLTACAAPMAAGPARAVDGVLVGANGMTLYTFDRDASGSGKSVCNGPCAANWPPLFADASASPSRDWSIVVRDDGKRQWAYRGKPVYYWVKDTRAGDRTGDGVNNAWRVARP